MRRNGFILCVVAVMLLVGLDGLSNGQAPVQSPLVPIDTTTELAVIWSQVYPGKDNHLIEVWMTNPDEAISGYDLTLFIGYSVIGHFSTDTSGDCIVDTTGCLASYLNLYGCSCYSEDCYGIEHEAFRGTNDPPIPTSGSWRGLFKINMDACCIPDSVNSDDRAAMITISGHVYDANAYEIPWHAHSGEVFIWVSVPGDANGDSLVNIGDVVFLGNYLFGGGAEPCVCEAADCNADTIINVSDQVYLLNYLYRGGPAPLPGKYACFHADCRPEE